MKTRLPMTIIARAALGCLAYLSVAAAFADAPPRSESSQTLVVPPEHRPRTVDLASLAGGVPGHNAHDGAGRNQGPFARQPSAPES